MNTNTVHHCVNLREKKNEGLTLIKEHVCALTAMKGELIVGRDYCEKKSQKMALNL